MMIFGPTTTQTIRRPRRRTAFTLVELLLIVTIFTFLLAGVAVALGTLLRAKGQLQDDLERSSQVARLVKQLRADAHRAVTAEEPDDTTIVFHSQQMQIKYLTETNRIVRTIVDGEETLHREVFPLATKTSIRWEVSESTPPLLSAVIEFEPEESAHGSVTDRVDAVIGLHRRSVP